MIASVVTATIAAFRAAQMITEHFPTTLDVWPTKASIAMEEIHSVSSVLLLVFRAFHRVFVQFVRKETFSI